ncbi:hypothetical protein EVAR_90900_1 [Eumeta japonica]|uniref:Uncharacterized protein n=1 Tax=Eumeta variegata TaxID=151549 RepID=A0A4C2A0V7_EUMVA|nr:hypothetical protein EVAR_90900_1 [Eumeta japonica]
MWVTSELGDLKYAVIWIGNGQIKTDGEEGEVDLHIQVGGTLMPPRTIHTPGTVLLLENNQPLGSYATEYLTGERIETAAGRARLRVHFERRGPRRPAVTRPRFYF